MKRTSHDKLSEAAYYRSGGMSIRDISAKTGLKRSTIQENLAHLVPGAASKPVGRPAKLSPRLKSPISRGFEQGSLMTATAAKKYLTNTCGVDVSGQTVRNHLRAAGMRVHSRPLKPRLTKFHKTQRLNFARAMSKAEKGFWESVVFTDESKHNLFAPDGHHFVWRRPGSPSLSHHIRETVKFGGGNAIVWGAITSRGVGKLVFIEGRMDTRLFVDVLFEGFGGTLEMHGLAAEEVYTREQKCRNAQKFF
jgi:transposase